VGHKKVFKNRQLIWGYFFIMPGILYLLLFCLGPILFSLIVSFTEWDVIRPMQFIGLKNYERMLRDPLIAQSLKVTAKYTLITVPALNVVTFFVAILLNAEIRGISFYRTVFYMPSIIPVIANSALWMFLYNPMYGMLNNIMRAIGMQPVAFLYNKSTVIPALAVMQIWMSGNTMVIYLAGLKGIPNHLYEAIEIDGGSSFHKLLYVTIPMMSPIIFYNVVMSIITCMQTFAQAYIMTEGGPDNASLFYVLHLYRMAFKNQQMGYASAMSWVLFVIICLLTAFLFRVSRDLVYYESGDSV